MSIWSISGADFTSLGIQGLTRTRRSQAVDTFTFTQKTTFDSAPLWAFKSQLQITRSGAPFFSGVLTKPTAAGSAADEHIEYEISGPWWWLERIIYQQPWYGVPTPHLYPRVILGQHVDSAWSSTIIPTGTQISDILTYAISCGAYLQIGSIAAGCIPPIETRVSITCAEAIKMMLRWMPDCVAWFDYTTSPPTFNVTSRAAGSPVNFAIASSPLESVSEIIPLNELVVPAVVLYYEQKSVVDGTPSVVLHKDAAPGTATGQEDGAIVQCIELSGSNASYQRCNVKTAQVPWSGHTDDDPEEPAMQWFIDHDPQLAGLTPANLSLDSSLTPNEWITTLPNQKDCNGNTITGFDTPSYSILPRELKPGSQLPGWLCKPATPATSGGSTDSTTGIGSMPLGSGSTDPGDGYLHAVKVNIVAELTYDFSAAGISDTELAQASSIFGSDNSYECCFDTILTDAQTQLYTKLVSSDPGETVPTGLAETLYDALKVLHYVSDVKLLEQECSAGIGVGNVLNLTGGKTEWASMAAQVQSVTEDIDAGATTIKTGPPSHLTPQDLVELLRAARTHEVCEYAKQRTTGTPTAAPTFDQSSTTGHTGSGSSPPSPVTLQPFQIVDASVTGGANVRIVASMVAGLLPTGFSVGDSPHYVMSISDGDIIYAEIDYDDTAGTVTSVSISAGSSLPTDDAGTKYVRIGSVAVDSSGATPVVTCANLRFGPINATLCRNFYVSSAPYFGINVS